MVGCDKIQLMGMEFYGYHGVFPEEREKGQLFLVDVEIFLSLKKAGTSDVMYATVNYAEVFDRVREIVEGKPVDLIETLAEKIAQKLLTDFGLIDCLKVTVHKPNASIAGIFQDVSVSIERDRV